MCGRYTLRTPLKDVLTLFDVESCSLAVLPARYNIAPTQQVPAVRLDPQGRRELALLQWGLVPSWADDPAIGNQLINARSETIASKPAFREAFRRRRCLIPADGFYEWKKQGRARQPFYIQLEDQRPFALAGLWESWHHGELAIESCTIITTAANSLLQELHTRMPVIVEPANFAQWLGDDTPREGLERLLATYPAEKMKLNPVSTAVNSPRTEGPQCVATVRPEKTQGSLFD
jgi:putative SOS response-associated peptidase YedK